MSTEQQADEGKTYTGSPEEVGAQLIVDALSPTLNESMKTVHINQLARMYAGILAGYTMMMLEHFGPQAAIDILRGTAVNLEKNMANGEIQGGAQH